jgi:hypothetical protein
MNYSLHSNLIHQQARPSIRATWLAALVLLALPAALQAQFNYVITNGTVTITGYTGPSGAVTIPSTINSLPVTGIGAYAFEDSPVSTVSIPDSVTNIGPSAFLGSYLSSISIPNSVTTIGNDAFEECHNLASITIPNRLTLVPFYAFRNCFSLTNVTIPNSVIDIGPEAFGLCSRLKSLMIPNSVTIIEDGAFIDCSGLTSLTIPDSVTTIKGSAFIGCEGLTNVVIGAGVANIWGYAFSDCTSVTGFFFLGGPPGLPQGIAFASDNKATIYCLPGKGWGPSFDGLPTALWPPPTIQTPPPTQTAEAGSAVSLRVNAGGPGPLFYLWYLNATNLISCGTNRNLELTNLQFSQSGAYTVMVTNAAGAVTSSPAMLNVIAPVERRPVRTISVAGEAGSSLNVEYTDSLGAPSSWLPLATVSLTNPPLRRICFDVSAPLPPQRFYRVWQAGTPAVLPSINLGSMVTAITLTGNIGDSLRLDYVNAIGPIDAWVILGTVTLTNTTQLYFDTSAWGQPPRLYRLVQVP